MYIFIFPIEFIGELENILTDNDLQTFSSMESYFFLFTRK